MKVRFVTLGCKLNFAESSSIGKALLERGHTRAQRGEEADICIINTCTVTNPADHKDRQTIHRIRRQNPNAIIIVTGCYAQLKPEEIADMNEVDYVLGQNEKFNIPQFIEELEARTESQEWKVKSQESRAKSTKTKVEMNGKRVLKDFSELRAIGKQMAKEAPQTPSKTISNTTVRNTVRQRTLAFERTLDLRGMRIDEATERLIAYMDDALMVGAGEVTILHGTGTGALKQLTRDYLSDINRQRHKRGQVPLEYGDGDVNHGGAGLTIVNL